MSAMQFFKGSIHFVFDICLSQVKVFKGRKTLAHALSDTKTAVNQLNKLVTGIIIIVTLIVWFLLMGFATTKVLLVISAQLVTASFMFGNTCKTVFDALMFVFVMHPFDVGDRCVIEGVAVSFKRQIFIKVQFDLLHLTLVVTW